MFEGPNVLGPVLGRPRTPRPIIQADGVYEAIAHSSVKAHHNLGPALARSRTPWAIRPGHRRSGLFIRRRHGQGREAGKLKLSGRSAPAGCYPKIIASGKSRRRIPAQSRLVHEPGASDVCVQTINEIFIKFVNEIFLKYIKL